jgi:hypothetical protein
LVRRGEEAKWWLGQGVDAPMGIDPAIQLTRAQEARAWDGDKKSRSRSEGSEAPRVTKSLRYRKTV